MSSMHELFDGSVADQDLPLPEPLFLLHTGALFDGERDDWDTEANSGTAVDALADTRPGATIGLHDEHAVRRLLAAERASRQAGQIENEALKAECARSGLELQRAVLAERERFASTVDRLRALLAEAGALFRFYEQSHRAKGPEHKDKADRNAEIAGRIEAALTPNCDLGRTG